MIEVKNLTKIYGKKDNQFTAIDDVSFEIPTGKSVAIVGKSGSGKSTLMHLLSSLDSPTSGQITIDGQNLTDMKPKQKDKFRAEHISFIFQSFFVQGNESCEKNVSLPLEIAQVPIKDRKAKIAKALRAVELLSKAKQKAKNLSGGQKQRLAVARAMVIEPKIIFADEPTGNLDSNTGAKIEKLLFEHLQDKNNTLIIVTHDLDLARKCDIQIVLKDGKIVKIIGDKK